MCSTNSRAVIYAENEDAGHPATPRVEKLPELKRMILRELARDPRNVLVIQAPIASGMLDEVRASGMPIINLGSYLETQLSQGIDPYYWPVTGMRGHWNHAAHPLIGRFLADQIISSGFLEGRITSTAPGK